MKNYNNAYQKNFADCVMVNFKFLNCDLCCYPYTVYKLNSFFYISG